MASATLNDALSRLVGTALSSVEFVQDYLQLRFGGPTLTSYTHPRLVRHDVAIFWGDPAYRNSLCALVGVLVKETAVAENKEVTLDFENGTAVKVSLESQDYRGPEALQFVGDDGSVWVT